MKHHDARNQPAEPISRIERLRAATQLLHRRLDARIMAERPFESQSRYGAFLQVQNQFHNRMAPLYGDKRLSVLIPGLAACARGPLVRQDMIDLGLSPIGEAFSTPVPPLSDAIGWLYVCEGSTLGAAILLKHVEKLGFSETFGARHLAAAPEGRAEHWRRFVAALNTVELPEAAEIRAEFGANAAYCFVYDLVERCFGGAVQN